MLVDTHCHLSGCFSAEFVWAAIQSTGQYYLASSYEEVCRAISFQAEEPRDFDRFLNKFNIIDKLQWTPDLIDIAIRDAAKVLNQVDYTLLSLSLDKYLGIGWHKTECIKFLRSCFDKHTPGKVGMLLAIKYENPETTIRQHAAVIDDADIYEMFEGIDFVGNERLLTLTYLAPICSNWSKKIVRLHIGEVQSKHSVIEVITNVKVNRIAHGLLGDDRAIEFIVHEGLPVDMCLSSNYFTGRVDDFYCHPLHKFLESGACVTIGSDDPTQFNTTLQKEYRIASKSGADVALLRSNAIRSCQRQLVGRALA